MVLEIIFIFHTPSLLGILVNIQGEMCVVVVIFLYQNICHFLTYFLYIYSEGKEGKSVFNFHP